LLSCEIVIVTSGRAVAHGAMVGLIGGLLAAGAMSLAHRFLSAIEEKDMVPTSRSEDPTIKVARAATRFVGFPLPERQKALAGAAVHYAFGGLVGGFYGAAAEIVPPVTRALGMPFGLAVWLGAHVVAVPAMGLAEPASRQPIGTEAEELGLHAVYGSVTELVRRLLRRL
jgi:putative membrane protein